MLKKWSGFLLCTFLAIILLANSAYAVTLNVNIYGPVNSPDSATLQEKTWLEVKGPNGTKRYEILDGQYSFELNENPGEEVTIKALQLKTSKEYTSSLPMTIELEETNTIDLHLTYPTVTGCVYAPNGVELFDDSFTILVEIKDGDSYQYYDSYNFTKTDGTNAFYKIGGFVIGNYRLKVAYNGDKEYTDSAYENFEIDTLDDTIENFNICLTELNIKGSIYKPDNNLFIPDGGTDNYVYIYKGSSVIYSTRIHEDGTYRFGNIPDGLYTIKTSIKSIIDGKYTDSLLQEIEVVNGEQIELDLYLSECSLIGKVVSRDEVAIKNETVYLYNANTKSRLMDTKTNTDGSFVFPPSINFHFLSFSH